MAEPSLSEIVNINADPTRGSGTPAVVLDNTEEIRQLNQSAQFKSQNDANKYNKLLTTFKEFAKDENNIASLPIATVDRGALQKQMTDIMSKISKDPKNYLGGKGLFDIQQQLSKLTSDAYESKYNNAFDLAHRTFLLGHPDLNTDENKGIVEGYLKDNSLGTRQPYMLNVAPVFDLTKFVGEGRKIPGIITPYSKASITPDKQNILEEEGETWNPAPFDKYFTGGLTHPDVRRGVENIYNQLPPNKKKAYENNGGLEAFWEDQRKLFSPPAGTYIKKSSLKSNPNYLEKEKLDEKTANDRANRAIEWAKISLSKDKFKNADTDDLVGAEAVINEATSIISKGEEVNVEGSGKSFRIGDPTLLNTFGNVDKNGKTTNVPDFIEYNKDKDQLNLVYYEGQTDSGKNIVGKKVPLDQRTWLKHIAKRSFPNKDIGKVNSLIEDVLKKNGNSLYKISQKQNTTASKKYTAKMPNGTIITSDDGQTWMDGNGNIIK